MTLRRVADNPLVALKDDLSLALRRIQLNLDTYCENPAEPAPLEVMVDAIDQIRGPLAALEHREAVALLEEMRATILELTAGRSSSLDPAILVQAIERLTAYLEDCLFPGKRRPGAELPDTATALRQARLQSARTDAGGAVAGGVDSASGLHLVQQTLKELRQIVADTLDGAPDHPESWEAIRGRLQLLHWMVAERNWTQVARVLGRLSPIIDRLAGGAAEHYGVLACGVCNEILAGLGYCLEPLNDGGPAPAVVLNKAEEHLNQLATLLNLPDLAETPPVELTSMVPGLAPAKPVTSDVAEPAVSDWPEVPALPAERADVTTPDNVIAIDLPGLDFEVTLAPGPGEAPPTSAGMPDLDWAATEDGSEAVATTGADLVSLIGMTETDPEFVEVFLEEAQGELATIQEQLDLWRANPSDRQVQITIRRAFHTLKGSGRMVGATVIGDFAWEFESLLNRVLDGSLSPAPAITDAVAAAVAALAPLVGQIPLRGGELDVLPALAARVRELVLVKPEPTMASAVALEIDPEFVEV